MSMTYKEVKKLTGSTYQLKGDKTKYINPKTGKWYNVKDVRKRYLRYSSAKQKQIAYDKRTAKLQDFKERNARAKAEINYVTTGFTRIFGIILCFMLIIMIIRITQGNQPPTFTGLLEKLSTAPVPTIPFINSSSITIGNGGALFGWLTDFLRLFVDMFNVSIFLINGLMSILTYVLWLLQWIFSA